MNLGKKARHTASITNRTSIFGIMGGTIQSGNYRNSIRSATYRATTLNKIPPRPTAGKQYMLDNNLLSRNLKRLPLPGPARDVYVGSLWVPEPGKFLFTLLFFFPLRSLILIPRLGTFYVRSFCIWAVFRLVEKHCSVENDVIFVGNSRVPGAQNLNFLGALRAPDFITFSLILLIPPGFILGLPNFI